MAWRSWIYTVKVPRPRGLRPRHAVQNQWDLLTPLGIPLPDPARNSVEMPVEADAAAAVAARLEQLGIRTTDPLVVIHVSAGNPFRRWPLEAFATLTEALVSRDPRTQVVITSGPSEPDAARRVVAAARARLPQASERRVLTLGDMSIVELRALLERATLYIGGDSGPLHVASTSSVPIVGLYGPTLPVRSEPWRNPALVSESVEVAGLECRPCNQRVCAPGDFRCLRRISAEDVLGASERARARAAGAP